MNLQVTNHFPTVNQTGIFLNETIKIYFNQAIEPSSIKWDVFSLNDNYSYASAVGSLGAIWASGVNLSGISSGLAFLPATYLLPNTEYSVFVYGKPNSILGKDGSEIPTTYNYNFVTGTGYYDTSGNIGVPSGTTNQVYDMDLTGISELEENAITNFSVYKTVPQNQTPNVSGSIIEVYFTGDIMTSSGEIGNYILIQESDVL